MRGHNRLTHMSVKEERTMKSGMKILSVLAVTESFDIKVKDNDLRCNTTLVLFCSCNHKHVNVLLCSLKNF